MRWNRKQLDEATTAARDKGFKEGRKHARRRAVLGFFFGTIFGAGGLVVGALYGSQIAAYAQHLFHQIVS